MCARRLCHIATIDDKEKVFAHMRTHGGCDTIVLTGQLFIENGKLKLIASEI